MDAKGEFIDVGAFTAEVEDTDFGIRDTAVEAGFGVWLWKWKMSICLFIREWKFWRGRREEDGYS